MHVGVRRFLQSAIIWSVGVCVCVCVIFSLCVECRHLFMHIALCDQIYTLHSKFQVLLFAIIQQCTKSSCTYHCQKFINLLLLRPYSWSCLTSVGALQWLVNGSNLPGEQTDVRELPQDWLVRLGIDVARYIL